jgi:hypothetical protein
MFPLLRCFVTLERKCGRKKNEFLVFAIYANVGTYALFLQHLTWKNVLFAVLLLAKCFTQPFLTKTFTALKLNYQNDRSKTKKDFFVCGRQNRKSPTSLTFTKFSSKLKEVVMKFLQKKT